MKIFLINIALAAFSHAPAVKSADKPAVKSADKPVLADTAVRRSVDAQDIRRLGRTVNELYKNGRLPESLQRIDEILNQVYVPNVLLLKCELLLRIQAASDATVCLDDFVQREQHLDVKQEGKVAELRGRILRAAGTPAVATLPAALEPNGAGVRGAPARGSGIWRRGWFWGAVATGVTTLAVGLSLGLTPRPYETVVWTR